MNWDDYRLILALVREKTVRGAARSLGVSHATVSRRLAHLNSRPGGPFIQKSPSGLWPSRSGAAVVEAAEKMEQIASDSARRQRAAGTQLSGPLCVSIPNPVYEYLLVDALTQFAERFPGIDLTLDVTDALADLDRAEADIAVRVSDTPPEHWVGRRLFPYMLSLYAHRDYLEAKAPGDYRWIAPPEDESRWPSWRVESPYPDAPVGLKITSIAGRFQALTRGLGLARAACFMAESEPDLMRLPNAPLFAAETLWVLGHPDVVKTDRAKAAIPFLAEALKSQRALIQGAA
ncbi:MAG: LysR family transcriptional regulator [Pseudomonadota bacterium]